jgi:hypothetical protein
MSGHEYELPGSPLSPAEQAKARRTLLGISTLYLGIALAGFAGVRPLRWLGALVVIIGAVLALSRPQGTGHALTPRNIRRIARIAAVPEVGAIVVVYGCLVAGFTGAIAIVTTTF